LPTYVRLLHYDINYEQASARGDTLCPRPSPPSVGAEAPHAAEQTET